MAPRPSAALIGRKDALSHSHEDDSEADETMHQSGSHDPALVAVSVLVAVAASYTALDLAGRGRAAAGRARTAWLAAAAGVMGGGIWAMHFMAMLAYGMPGMAPVYDPTLTAASFGVAAAVTGAGFLVTALWASSLPLLLAAGCFVGLGVSGMHVIGMSALQVPATLHYGTAWSGIGVTIAVLAATGALWLSARAMTLRLQAAAAGAMGLAIAGMHYAAMMGVTYEPCVRETGTALAGAVGMGRHAVGAGVAVAVLTILLAALAATRSDRKAASASASEAAALRLSEERLRNLYRRTPLPLFAMDAEGRIQKASDALLALLGRTRSEVEGRPLASYMTEASAARLSGGEWEALLQDGTASDVDHQVTCRSGKAIDVLLSASVEPGSDGRGPMVLAGLVDVTARKRAEEALRQAQKVEAIGHLTGGVAHDFNNLLAVVMGSVELAQRRAGDDAKLKRLLDAAMQGAQRGAGLTQRMLAFARKQELDPGPVDVPGLVRGMADLLRRSLGPTVHIDTRFPLELGLAHADANQLELAVLNLCVNARDAMPDGGDLTMSAEDRDVAPGAPGLPAGRYVCLSVTDTGIGMDAETLARASEPFFTTKGVGKGTGLGLSMVHGLAEQSGGRLCLRSQPGIGTTADLWLPAHRAGDAAGNADAPAEAATPATHRALSILVVDDDALVLGNTAARLEDLGHRVTVASSGQDALRLLERDVVDALVTDHAMPGMTGLQLADRARGLHPGLPVLVVSGYAELPSQGAGYPRLAKPFTQAALARAVDEVARPEGDAMVIPIRVARPKVGALAR